jgi:hypothetical protein
MQGICFPATRPLCGSVTQFRQVSPLLDLFSPFWTEKDCFCYYLSEKFLLLLSIKSCGPKLISSSLSHDLRLATSTLENHTEIYYWLLTTCTPCWGKPRLYSWICGWAWSHKRGWPKAYQRIETNRLSENLRLGENPMSTSCMSSPVHYLPLQTGHALLILIEGERISKMVIQSHQVSILRHSSGSPVHPVQGSLSCTNPSSIFGFFFFSFLPSSSPMIAKLTHVLHISLHVILYASYTLWKNLSLCQWAILSCQLQPMFCTFLAKLYS